MNLVDLLGKLSAAMNDPFAIHWTEYSARCLLFFTLVYGIVALVVTSNQKNRRRGEEHGSADDSSDTDGTEGETPPEDGE